jgi:hypothetical protein
MTPFESAFWRWLPLAALAVGLCLLVHVSVQQVLRSGGDDPQVQMAEDAARALEAGAAPEALLPPPVEVGKSLAPFLIILDDRASVRASSGTLDGKQVLPPAGILDFVRSHGEERVTWQPGTGVRLATVVVRVAEPAPGFVVAGRSLREVEERERQSLLLCALAAAILLPCTAALTLLGEFATRKGPLGKV